MSVEKISRREAVSILFRAYKDKVKIFGFTPGDSFNHDAKVSVTLPLSEWEAIYKAFKAMVEE